MNREDIIRMAQEAGIGVTNDLDDCAVPVWHLGIDYLERFAALVAAAEREACAKVAETYKAASSMKDAPHIATIFKDCARAIRARSKG